MTTDPASAWLEESQTPAFFEYFRTNDQALDCIVSNAVYSAIRSFVNADREDDDDYYNLDEAQLIKVVLFRHLYGAPSCRSMKQAGKGLFAIGLFDLAFTQAKSVESNNVLLKITIPGRMLSDLTKLKDSKAPLKTLPVFTGKIVEDFIAGLCEFPADTLRMKDKDFFNAVANKFNSKEVRLKLNCSGPLNLFITREASTLQSSGISRYQFFNDVLTHHAYGFTWCERAAQSGLKTTFSPPQLIPVCRVANLTRQEWGALTDEIEYAIPQQLENDLIQVARTVPPKPQLFSEYVRNTVTYYLIGHVYFADRKC